MAEATSETIKIDVGPWKLAATLITVAGALLAGVSYIVSTQIAANNAVIMTLVDERLDEHTRVPHPTTLEEARRIAETTLQRETRQQRQLSEKLAQIEVKQAGFSSDISWIKSHLVKISEDVEAIRKAQSSGK